MTHHNYTRAQVLALIDEIEVGTKVLVDLSVDDEEYWVSSPRGNEARDWVYPRPKADWVVVDDLDLDSELLWVIDCSGQVHEISYNDIEGIRKIIST